MTVSILFVCLGNICRSPLAEAAFRVAAARHGIAAHVDSAGTGGWHAGDAPDQRSRAVARAHGVDITAYRARQICADDYRRFDWIFALDRQNLRDLAAMAPVDATAETGLLLDILPGPRGRSVPDPYYGEEADFERVWTLVADAADALAAWIAAASGQAGSGQAGGSNG